MISPLLLPKLPKNVELMPFFRAKFPSQKLIDVYKLKLKPTVKPNPPCSKEKKGHHSLPSDY